MRPIQLAQVQLVNGLLVFQYLLRSLYQASVLNNVNSGGLFSDKDTLVPLTAAPASCA